MLPSMLSRRSGLRVLAAAAVLSVAVGASAWATAPQAQASTSRATAPQAQASTDTVQGYVQIYQNANRGGASYTFNVLCDTWGCWSQISAADLRSFTFNGGPCWKNFLGGGGNWNDCVSSIVIVNYDYRPFCVRAWNDPNYTGLSQQWRIVAQTIYVPQVSYNDSISSISIFGSC
jgi:hypothetical protein